MACQGCAARRKALKRFFKTVFKGNNAIQVPDNGIITQKYLDKVQKKFGKS